MKPEELAKKLSPDQLLEFKRALMQRVVLAAQAHSQRATPVRTGHLRRSETTRVERTGERGFVGTNVIYATHVHARVPFFEIGIAETMQEIDQILSNAAEAFFEQVAS